MSAIAPIVTKALSYVEPDYPAESSHTVKCVSRQLLSTHSETSSPYKLSRFCNAKCCPEFELDTH